MSCLFDLFTAWVSNEKQKVDALNKSVPVNIKEHKKFSTGLVWANISYQLLTLLHSVTVVLNSDKPKIFLLSNLRNLKHTAGL